MLEITSKQVVKTRKKHECFGCAGIIGKSADAVNIKGKEDGRHRSFYMHLECHIVANINGLYYTGLEKGGINKYKSDLKVLGVELPF